MKIAQPSGGGDFYESFSDLIFGTLIIFLVVVLALILQVHETVKAMDNKIGGVVTPHRFTGATGQTTFAFAILPGEVLDIDETVVAMFPYAVSATWDIPREEGVVDPVLDICRLYLDDNLLLMPVSDFVGMAGSLTPDATLPDLQTCPALHQSSFGEIVYRVYTLKQRDAAALAAMSPEQVRDAIGGINLYSPYEPWTRANILRWFDNPQYPFRNASQFYQDFMEDLERAEREMITPFNIASTGPGVDPPAGVRITQGEGQTIKVGTSQFSKKDFILLLGAISPGRGFVVEYIDPDADKPVAPPGWIMDEVLGPAGYDAWVVKDPVEGE